MGVRHPYNDSTKFATGGIYAPTAANFPSLKHWYKCTETAGTVTVVDAIGASNMTSVSVTNPDAYSIDCTLTGKAVATAFSNIGSSPFLLFTVGKFGAAANFSLQDATTGASLDLSTAGSQISADGITYRPSSLTAYANAPTVIYGRGLFVSAFNSATGMYQVEANATTGTSATVKDISGASITSLTTNSAPPNGIAITFTNTNTALYGLSLFIFSSAPSVRTIQSACTWMTYQWSIGNKWISPDLKGIS